MNTQQRDIDLEAALWLVRLDDVQRSADAKEQQEWIAWLQRSPQHVQAYFDMANLSQSVDEMPPQARQRVRELLAANRANNSWAYDARLLAEDNAIKFSRRHWLITAAAATLVTAIALWWTADRHQYDAGVGQQLTYTLEDGSSMVLNTRSRARVSMNERERMIELEGEALFTVARDANRPFLVRTRNAVTRAVGTQFNVYQHADDATRISVVEGAVSVTSSASPTDSDAVLVSAGQQVEVHAGAVAKQTNADVAAAVAWRKKLLVFEDATLREVAAQFNRYNAVQFTIGPEVNDEHRLSGTFDPARPELFQTYLEKDEALQVRVRGDSVQISTR